MSFKNSRYQSSWNNIILAHNCKHELLVWKANSILHGKYYNQRIPVPFNSSQFQKTRWSIPYSWDFDTLIKKSQTNNTTRSQSKQSSYKSCIHTKVMSIISILLPRNVSKLYWQRKFFSVPSWSNKAPLLLCMLNCTHMRPYKYFSHFEFHNVNWSQGSRHEFLERWWLLLQVAYKRNNTRLFVSKVMNSPRQTCSKQG